jgi:hypothetical protein
MDRSAAADRFACALGFVAGEAVHQHGGALIDQPRRNDGSRAAVAAGHESGLVRKSEFHAAVR